MQIGLVAPGLAYCPGEVTHHVERLDKPRLRAQNFATLPAPVETCHGNSHGLADQGGTYE